MSLKIAKSDLMFINNNIFYNNNHQLLYSIVIWYNQYFHKK